MRKDEKLKPNTREQKSGKKTQDLFVKHFPQNAL